MAYNKNNMNNPINRLVNPNTCDYTKDNSDLSLEDKSNLMGIVGTLRR